MAAPMGYLLCGTPRTGSTLLCSLLTGTGVMGRPESYFREPDEQTWAERFGLPTDGQHVHDYPAFVEAVRVAATTDNGVFGARIMWGTLERVMQGLDAPQHQSNLSTLQSALGPLRFVHLQRKDSVGQAVSWARAEQTGYWQHGDVPQSAAEPDVGQMIGLWQTIHEHNVSWRTWFSSNGIEPYDLAYEDLEQHPTLAVEGIADLLGVAPLADWRPASLPRKQADRVNARWSELLRTALASGDY